MTATHVPVLLRETVDLLARRAAASPIDCTFGAGGHARAIAERLGPDGTLIAIDRDPDAEARFDELTAEVAVRDALHPRGLRRGAGDAADEDVRADIVLLDLGMSSMQVDTRERGFSYAYDAPLDMRMDPTSELAAREVVNEWDERGLSRVAARAGRGALRPPDRPRDRARTCARADRDDDGARRRRHRGGPRAGAVRAAGIRPSAPSRRSGSPSTTSSDSSTRRCRSRGASSASEAGLQGFPSTAWKTGA